MATNLDAAAPEVQRERDSKGSWVEKLTQSKPLGKLLRERNMITNEQLEECLVISQEQKRLLGGVLQEKGYVTELDILKVFSEELGMQVIPNLTFKHLTSNGFDSGFFGKFTPDVLSRYGIIPVKLDVIRMQDVIQIWKFHVIFSNPWLFNVVKRLAEDYGKRVQAEKNLNLRDVATSLLDDVQIDIIPYLATTKDIQDTMSEITRCITYSSGEIASEDDEQSAARQIREILTAAIQKKATDVHISPMYSSGGLWVRFRIDGPLIDHARNGSVTEYEYNTLLNKVMNMANMDSTRKREPQDGSMQFLHERIQYDMRVAVIPTSMTTTNLDGCKIQIRILYKTSNLTVSQLGFFRNDLETVQKLYTRPNGIFLLSGPTSSGKTTTIYACLRTLDLNSQCCYTVEDPVEYTLDGAYQIQVAEEEKRGFARILKSLMRLDPNIVFMGEMRDPESAEMAVQIANTGHSVFSTVHTNSAYTAPQRLMSMGIPSYLLIGNLNGVVSQRLVRRNCPDCLVSYTPSEKILQNLGLDPVGNYRMGTGMKDGVTCPTCKGLGYIGRMGIFEIMPLALYEGWEGVIDKPMELHRFFIERGHNDMLGDAKRKIAHGEISPDSLYGVLSRSEQLTE